MKTKRYTFLAIFIAMVSLGSSLAMVQRTVGTNKVDGVTMVTTNPILASVASIKSQPSSMVIRPETIGDYLVVFMYPPMMVFTLILFVVGVYALTVLLPITRNWWYIHHPRHLH